MKILLPFLLVFGFTFRAEAKEQAFLEKPVREFLDSKSLARNTFEVLLVFSSKEKSDSEKGTLPISVKSLKERNREILSELQRDHFEGMGQAVDPIWILNGAFARLDRSQIKTMAKDPRILGIYEKNRIYRIRKTRSAERYSSGDFTYGLKKIELPEVQKNFPHLSGKGVRVGILDTGISINHPDLKGKLRIFKNFSPAKEQEPRDDFGHGTHVAGTIVGGSASGQAIGVAPEAELIVGRIFDGDGESTRELILKSMEWMADPDGNPATADYAQVINSSWSDDEPYADRDWESEPFCRVIDTWVQLNMIPVFSAGNTGPSPGTINLPAGCPNAFSVGATEYNDRSPHFSSTGPAVWKSVSLMKPEVSAPGFHIKSANKYGGYEEMSGTSMAAPHVTGAFAILLQAYPGAGAEQIKNAMLAGAKDLGSPSQDPIFGWGRIDILNSLKKLSGSDSTRSEIQR